MATDTTIYVDTSNPVKVQEHYQNYLKAMKKSNKGVLTLDALSLDSFLHVISIAVVYISGTGLKWRIKDQGDKLF